MNTDCAYYHGLKLCDWCCEYVCEVYFAHHSYEHSLIGRRKKTIIQVKDEREYANKNQML